VSAILLASECPPDDPGFCAPTVLEFYPKPWFSFHLAGMEFAVTRIMFWSWVATAAMIVLLVLSVRRPQLVPGRGQWLGESAYSFIRDGVAREVMGREGLRFAPYLASLFLFILANNLLGIIPFAQLPPTARFAYPVFLAAITYILFNWIGIRQHGFVEYLKMNTVIAGVPKPMLILVSPIEFLSTFVFRPFTLAVRLFANMFAGHLLIAVFSLGAAYLLTVGNFSLIFSPVSFVMAIVMTFFELLVIVLQAYVFTVLTAVYVSGALEEAH
jgi:ATP synthase subunit 6